jgi:hypothetical protein
MRTRSLLPALLLFLAVSLGAVAMHARWIPPQGEGNIRSDARKSKKAAERADKSLAEGSFEEALAALAEAVHYTPGDANLRERFASLQSKVVRGHVDAAERYALAGNLGAVTEELAAALRLDPGNANVAERMAQMRRMEDGSARRSASVIEGLPKVHPKPGKRDVNLRGDTRTVYEQIGNMFGVKVSFDADLGVKAVRLRGTGLDFYTALSILSAQTATFWKPLNSDLIFVAADTQEKRREYGMLAEQTFPISSAAGPEDVTEMLRILRELTGATHVSLDTRSRTITMRATPEILAIAEQLIKQIDKARGEVLLEIELLEVDRNKARQLGITPPTSTQLIPLTTNDLNKLRASTDLTNLLTNIQQVFAAKGFSSVPSVLPIGGGLSTLLLTIPTEAAQFSDTLSLVHSGRQVLLRAQDGKPATFFVGDRYPITLSLLSGSVAGGAIPTQQGTLTGTIFPETQFAVGKNPTAVVANAFTGGTLPDLAVVYNETGNHTIAILQNQDKGNFQTLAQSPVTLGVNETGQIAVATDVLRTGTTSQNTAQPPDLVLVNSTSNNISILLGNVDSNGKANGTFTEAKGSPFAVGNSPSAVVIADFNGDGIKDIAVANEADNSISFFRGNGDGTFTEFPGSPFKLPGAVAKTELGPTAMLTANFRDKTFITSTNSTAAEIDLAVVNQTSNNVSVLLSSVDSSGNVTFSEAPNSPITVGTNPVAIATADFNLDAIIDLAVVNKGSNSLTILLGNSASDGSFAEATGSPLQTGDTPAGIAVANFTNGTTQDIAITNSGPKSNSLGVYIGLGNGTFAAPIELTLPTNPTGIIASVLTSSGLPDVAVVAQDPNATQGIVAIVQDSQSFANTSVAGAAQVPYPASEYIDLGVKIKATPMQHSNDEVTLQLEFEIRSRSGANVNGIPILSNRTLSQTVRVKMDEPSLIAGMTDVEETRTITSLPGFAEIPGASYALGTRNNSAQDTELLIVVTPHRLRLTAHLTRSIFAGRGDPGGASAPPPAVRPPNQ